MFLLSIISFIIHIYLLIVVAQVLISWLVAFDIVNASNEAAIRLTTLLNKFTDPVFKPIRKYVPPIGGMDFTPLIVIIGLQLIPSLLLSIIY